MSTKSTKSTENEAEDKTITAPSGRKYHFLDTSDFTDDDFHRLANEKDQDVRRANILKKAKTECTPEITTKVQNMTIIEEATSILLFLLGVPGAAYSLPVIGTILYKIYGTAVVVGFVACLVALAYAPAKFSMGALNSWPAIAILRYFSFKGVFATPLDSKKSYILVAPPHGVFPFGNIVTMIAFPSMFGYPFKGLAADAALRMPIFRQLLVSIGVIDASRKSATAALKAGHTVGISTGGVAEVFETDSATGDEAIVLRERKGLIKLAIRTGSPLVPSYLFGNTKLFSLYAGGENGSTLHSFLKNLSRRIGFATIVFWGRFFLPIPYRTPIVGAMGVPIEVVQCDEPTPEYVDEILEKLLVEMKILFDDQKANYGWADKHLVIK